MPAIRGRRANDQHYQRCRRVIRWKAGRILSPRRFAPVGSSHGDMRGFAASGALILPPAQRDTVERLPHSRRSTLLPMQHRPSTCKTADTCAGAGERALGRTRSREPMWLCVRVHAIGRWKTERSHDSLATCVAQILRPEPTVRLRFLRHDGMTELDGAELTDGVTYFAVNTENTG